jgi:hypothetical protein
MHQTEREAQQENGVIKSNAMQLLEASDQLQY